MGLVASKQDDYQRSEANGVAVANKATLRVNVLISPPWLVSTVEKKGEAQDALQLHV